jgi:hypothetical protein
LKGKLDLTLSALSRISATESNALTQKWINLLCMKPPMDDENENEEVNAKALSKRTQSEKCKIFTNILRILKNEI